jgi:hypothetical protein
MRDDVVQELEEVHGEFARALTAVSRRKRDGAWQRASMRPSVYLSITRSGTQFAGLSRTLRCWPR